MKSTFPLLSAALAGLLAASAAFAHDHAAAPTSPDNYPLTTCVVSGDKLGEMGDSVKYVYKQPGQPDRVVEFCCKDCIKDFEKDPAKYLAKLDAATGHPTAAAAKTALADGDCAGCTMPADCPVQPGKATTATVRPSADSQAVLTQYVPVAEALAADDLAKAKTAAGELAKQAGTAGLKVVATPALAVAHADNLDAARAAFKTLSMKVAPLAQGIKGYVVMHCPMADADWVQTDATVRNPYLGKTMLTCGAPKA